MLMNSHSYYMSLYLYHVDIYFLLMDDAWKKEGTLMLC
jgi:hypothetical protein